MDRRCQPAFADVPNIPAPLEFPMYVDVLPDNALVVVELQNCRAILHRSVYDDGAVAR